jgi:putative ABC transport system substrate-binding protein
VLDEFVMGGGLLSYGPDPLDVFRRAASYVDRILRGENPGDLPVQLPVKYEMGATHVFNASCCAAVSSQARPL